jgi:hypothetical protein
MSTTLLVFSLIFYCLTLINPGYVAKGNNFIVLLERML